VAFFPAKDRWEVTRYWKGRRFILRHPPQPRSIGVGSEVPDSSLGLCHTLLELQEVPFDDVAVERS
jgi:hypothetical protein